MQFSLVFCLLISLAINCAEATDPIVDTKLGKIRGSILKTVNNREIQAFRGIYYAEAPIGNKRFKPPTSVPRWGDTIYDATKDGFQCPQPSIEKELISENCLILNVYRPSVQSNEPLPVLVYIHGGSNYLGSSNSESDVGPDYLMDHDIVMVSMNYRLGALGFLSTKTPEAPGNYGFLDQLMALKWVRDNIASFGGDPHSVTLAGQSSGGTAISLHMASPLSKGLFHKAIIMSGSYTNHYHLDSVFWARKVATELACPMYNPKDLIDCLRNKTWEQLIEVRGILELYELSDEQWNYEVDGHFLLDSPANVFARGDFNKVPIMAGITKDELTYLFNSQANNTGLQNDISVNFDKYAPKLFIFDPKNRASDKSNRIKRFYLKDKKIQDQPFSNFAVIFSDALINHGMHRLVELARKHVDVYYYRFDYLGRFSLVLGDDGKPRGVGHVDDLQYILGTIWFDEKIGINDPEMFMVNRITRWWTSFARNGVPGDEDGVKWLPSNCNSVYTMYNNKKIRIGAEPFQDRYRLWDEMFPVRK